MQLIKNLVKKKRYIAFIGDSFCAAISREHYEKNGRKLFQPTVEPTHAAFPSVVADHYNLNLLAHGYSGKSWWYSRSEFLKQINSNPRIKDKLEAIVFCHSSHSRINSDSIYATTANSNNTRDKNSYLNEEDRLVSKAQILWTKHLYDDNFQIWSQLNWFREITREWSQVKQVHFHCFKQPKEQDNHLLIGQRFTTPLIQISVSERQGTQKEVTMQIANDTTLANHMSDDNNRVLAEITIDALDNYKHQINPIDMSKFNIVNPNYANFPNGNFGSY